VTDEKTWPKPGDRLVHKFRKRAGEIEAQVISVDRDSGRIAVEVDDKIYPTLSAAGSAISGHATNGWTYWGLKKQKSKPRADY
jgi:uncharacterized protein (DUF697 family)